MRKLTQQELDLLNKLYQDKELSFRGSIREFIIRNTYEPKYKVGDYVKVTSLGSYIWGNPVIEVNAEIKEILWFLDEKGKEQITYGMYAYDQDGKDHYICAEENIKNGQSQSRLIIGKSDTNMNYFKKKSEYSQSTSLHI